MKGVLKRGFGRGTCPYRLAFFLDFSLRRFILSPERLADRLELNETSRVLELGQVRVISARLWLGGYPKDTFCWPTCNVRYSKKAREKLARAGFRKTGLVQANGTALPLPSGAWDCAFLVAVLGEVPEPTRCLEELYRVLRPKKFLSLTEQPGDPDFIALPEPRKLVEGVRFRFEKVFGGGKNYLASSRKEKVIIRTS